MNEYYGLAAKLLILPQIVRSALFLKIFHYNLHSECYLLYHVKDASKHVKLNSAHFDISNIVFCQ